MDMEQFRSAPDLIGANQLIDHRHDHNLRTTAFLFSSLRATNIQTLISDIYGTNFDSIWCRFKGYWVTVVACAIYHTFVVQIDHKKRSL